MTALGQKRTSSVSLQMSASGHERTFMRKRQNVSLGSGAALRLTVSDSFSGPHLHYEVLINSRFVDLAIQVSRELSHRTPAVEFQKERAHRMTCATCRQCLLQASGKAPKRRAISLN